LTHVHIDPVSGVAGDMLLGALIDAGVAVDDLLGPLRSLPLPASWSLDVRRETRLGLAGTRASVLVDGEDAGGAWHSASGPSAHHGTHLDELLDIVRGGALPEPVRDAAIDAFTRLAEAEAAAHGTTLDAVHMHEVGGTDAVIDLCGGLLGLHLLGATSVSCGPLPLGSGTVRCAHGVMPVPVPAVVQLLCGVPTVPGAGAHPTGELCTPTGVALLRAVAQSFGPPPPMRIDGVGVGLGRRERADVPNVVRLLLGERESSAEAQTVTVLSTTLDDLDGRVLPHVVRRLLSAGALDVTTAPVHGKKGRPALLIEALAPNESVRAALAEVLFRETPTLGVRWRSEQRATLARSHRTVTTPYGPVRLKEGSLDGRIVTAQPELDDCLELAESQGLPLADVIAAAVAAGRA